MVRYRLLEPLRQYGLERLERAGGRRRRGAERHACYFLVLAKALEPRLESGDRDAALARLDAEHANLRRALGWCHAAGECGRKEAVEIGLGLSGRLFWFWYFRGRLPEACRWTEALLALPAAAAPAARARALLTAGRAAWLLGEDQIARQRLEEGAALWRRVGDGAGPALAQTLVILGMVTEAPGAARAALDEGEALFRALGDAWGLALALRMQGLRAFQRGDDDDARRWMEEGLALSRALRDRWFVAQTLNHLGDVARRQGNYAGAAARYEESLALFRPRACGAASLACCTIWGTWRWPAVTPDARCSFSGRACACFGSRAMGAVWPTALPGWPARWARGSRKRRRSSSARRTGCSRAWARGWGRQIKPTTRAPWRRCRTTCPLPHSRQLGPRARRYRRTRRWRSHSMTLARDRPNARRSRLEDGPARSLG